MGGSAAPIARLAKNGIAATMAEYFILRELDVFACEVQRRCGNK